MTGKLTRRDMLKLSGGGLAGAALLGVAGCGSGAGSSGGGGTLTLGTIGWEENVVVANLTKILLEDDLNYDEVEIQGPLELGPLAQGVAGGDLHAWQDVWLPNNQAVLDKVEEDVQLLEPWYEDQTSYGLAVPDYVDVQSLADLGQVGIDQITGIEASASFMPVIRNDVIPGYNLDMELVTSSTAGMLSELQNRYSNEEPIVFPGWSPHWMNQEYDFHYLDDPKNLQGAFDNPSRITTVVNADLSEDDPVALAFMKALSLGEDEVNAIEAEINNSDAGWDDPAQGVRAWLEGHRDVVQPWVRAAKQAQ